jgi:hypothetical protein
MNIYQLIIITLALSQSFLCISSELSDFQPLTEKLRFPDNTLQQYARKELEKRYPNHSFLKNNPAPQTSIDQKLEYVQKLVVECKEKDLLFQKLVEERNQIQKEVSLKKQRLLANAQKESEKRGKSSLRKQTVSAKNKTVSPTSLTTQSPIKSPCTMAQQRYKAFKLLCDNYGAAGTKADLCAELTARCDKIYNNEKSNDSLSGPYFDQDKHVLSGAINATWSFAYCPCDGDLKYLNVTFCNLSQSADFFNTCCKAKNCKQYKMDSYSSATVEDITNEDVLVNKNSSSEDDSTEVLYGKHTATDKEENSRLKKYLLKKYNVHSKKSLIAKLKTLCAHNPHGPELSYDQEDHSASGQLTDDWIFQVHFDSGNILFCKMSRLPNDTIDWPQLDFSNKNGSSASSE